MKTVRSVAVSDSDLGQLVRFSLVYILLFLLMLCESSRVFGQTESSQLSLETFEAKPPQASTPIFGNYYIDPALFKGDYKKTASEIESLVRARQDLIEKLRLGERSESARLKEEHKTLMWSAGNQGYDVADKKNAEYSKWSVAMYANISQQALIKQNTEQKISSWDAKNHLKVKSVEKNGKKYIVSVQIFREKQKDSRKAVASIP